MVFAKEHNLEKLRKELEHLIDVIELKEKQGLTVLRREDGGHYY